MRLKRINLSGFKSFVDSTGVVFPGNMCAVVGPNGCGKSNIIDAVRWVMGESSARNLRGEQMSDVIFNGSEARKPVGRAAIELVFDNRDGAIGGEYASYAEISIKREVERDGPSEYELNGSRCRRRDITDIFLGTGLGPRSYAIIEQGMITRLIESRPEELRVFIEEAAGISKYRERRKETESRMRRTEENLKRLTDLRDELGRQLQHLKRQAQAAEKYAAGKEEERLLKAQLQALQWQALDGRLKTGRKGIGELEVKLEAVVAEQRQVDAGIEQLRQDHGAASESFNEVQGRYYSLGTEVAGLEQSLKHQRKRGAELTEDLARTAAGFDQSKELLEEDRAKQSQWAAELAEIAPELKRLQGAEQVSSTALTAAEEEMQGWQGDWDAFNQRAAEPQQQAGVQQSRIQHLEQAMERVRRRMDDLEQEKARLSEAAVGGDGAGAGKKKDGAGGDKKTDGAGADKKREGADESGKGGAAAAGRDEKGQPSRESLSGELAELDQAIADQRERANALLEQVNEAREQCAAIAAELDEARGEQQAQKGRLASLEALQQGAGAAGEAAEEWLRRGKLQGQPRLLELIKVEEGWQLAVETVLGGDLQAVTVADIDGLAALLEAPPAGTLTLLESGPAAAAGGAPSARAEAESETDAPPLAAKVAPLASDAESAATIQPAIESLLGAVLAAPDLRRALELRRRLQPGQSVITPEGIWLSPAWARIGAPAAEGAVARQRELDALRESLPEAGRRSAALEGKLEALSARLKQLEQERHGAQENLHTLNRRHAEISAGLSAEQARSEQLGQRREDIDREIAESRAQFKREQESLAEARRLLSEAIEAMDRDSGQREELLSSRDQARAHLDQARQAARRDKDAAHQAAMQHQSLQTQLDSIGQSIERVSAQVKELGERQASLQQEIASNEAPLPDMQEQLESRLKQRLAVEGELGEARQRMEAIAGQLQGEERKRADIEQRAGALRGDLEQRRLDHQGLKVQRETLEQQLSEAGAALEEVLAGLPKGAAEKEWADSLERIGARIARLGPVNLAAADEYEQQSERKQYLDAQNEDIETALDTLASAIRKIDRETRARFQETFDQVNASLKELFPRVFGGGSSRLEMTGDDLLDTGITIMAQPPGKKNATIHLLSGGEKALTAIALVFAIFRLNPAPFCMLDEVDAPLDDANTARYARMLKEMAEHVQFIFITHNKITMEQADHLMGVTMHEAGVSRLVSVDVEEAVKMAAS